MVATDVQICSDAARLAGANAIQSFSDGSKEAETAAAIYPDVRDSNLISHPWRFNTTTVQISQLSAAPDTEYSKAYQLPSNFLNLNALIGSDGKLLTDDYDLYGDKLVYTDYDGVLYADYQFKQSDDKFPPFFRHLLKIQMAMYMALSVAEDENKAANFEAVFEKLEAKYRRVHARQRKTRLHNTINPLISVRGG